MSYVEARNWILQWQGDLEVKNLLASMLATSALDMTFPPSKRRKSMDPSLRGQHPDFFACAALPKRQCHLFTVEVKKVTQGLVVQSDLEKLACEMRDAIDDLAKQKIDISSVRVFGMVVIGLQGDIYSMALEANGLYVMRSYTTIYAPRTNVPLPHGHNFFFRGP